MTHDKEKEDDDKDDGEDEDAPARTGFCALDVCIICSSADTDALEFSCMNCCMRLFACVSLDWDWSTSPSRWVSMLWLFQPSFTMKESERTRLDPGLRGR